MNKFATQLKLMRKANNLSQSRLAKKAGCTKSWISRIESGKGSPSVECALKLARALNVSITDLAGDTPGAAKRKARAAAMIAEAQYRDILNEFREMLNTIERNNFAVAFNPDWVFKCKERLAA